MHMANITIAILIIEHNNTYHTKNKSISQFHTILIKECTVLNPMDLLEVTHSIKRDKKYRKQEWLKKPSNECC